MFRVRLWRFGQWTDVLVDDFLPVIDDQLVYCPSLGNNNEFWGPLVEKAYAKYVFPVWISKLIMIVNDQKTRLGKYGIDFIVQCNVVVIVNKF